METSLGIRAVYHDKFSASPTGSDGALHFTDNGLVQFIPTTTPLLSRFLNLSVLFEYLSDVQNLETLGIQIIDLADLRASMNLRPLRHMHSINLAGARGPGLDLSALSGVHSLDCSHMSLLVDTQVLAHVSNLYLNYCPSLRSIRTLLNKSSSVHSLSCHACPCGEEFMDIDCTNVHTLDLTATPGLTSVGPFRMCHTLTLSACPDLVDLASGQPSELHTLNLSRCQHIQSIPNFQTLHSVNLSGLPNLKNIGQALKGVHTVDVSMCTDLQPKDLVSLAHCHAVNLSGCVQLQDVQLPAFKFVYELNLSHTNIRDVSALRTVSRLNLAHCQNLETLDWRVCYCQALDLSYTAIRSVSSCRHVNELNLEGCADLRSPLADLKAVLNLNLRCIRSPPLDIQALAYVPMLSLDQSVIGHPVPQWLTGYEANPTSTGFFELIQR